MIHVLIVDAYTVLRHGLRLILQEDPELTVVGEAANSTDALAQVTTLGPDVVLIDPNLPDSYGIETIRSIRTMEPQTQVLVLTTSEQSIDILATFKAGAKGYLSKNVTGAEVVQAIHQVALGQAVLPPTLATCLLDGLAESIPASEQLTNRERDVLTCLTQGLGNREIATALNISQNTVKTHMRRILSKLNLRSRTEAATYALQKGLILKN